MTSSLVDPNETFASLTESVGLDNRLRKAVQRLGHVRPTLVQSKCLPLAISSGRDMVVRAKTGSGKTLAYCLPLLQKILQGKESSNNNASSSGVRAVVLVPTRELCSQVYKTLKSLTYYCDEIISVAVLSSARGGGRGGKGQQELTRQRAMLRDRPDVVVATPAGLLTHLRSGDISLKDSMETLVVDEADLVLSFGYTGDITEIMKSMPRICQGFLMSATLSPELNSLKKVVLNSPVVLKLEEEESRQKDGQLTQFYLQLPRKDKNLVIYVFLKLGLLKGKGIFFVNSIDGGYKLKLFLEQFHIRSSVLNAELPFRSRLNIIEQFNVGNFDYLIATDESTDATDTDDEGEEEEDEQDMSDNDAENIPSDIKKKRKKDEEYGVSRGLDFRNVSFVLNVDFPPSARSYAHRVGRTARGGAKGVALSLVDIASEDQFDTLQAVQEDQPKIPITGAATETLQSSLDTPTVDSSGLVHEQFQPSPLDFDLREIEGFRYRVEDVARAVTKSSVKEARAAELRAEILNSDRLQSHFEENPTDLQLLRHDRLATHVTRVQDHLKHVPKYLLPRGMEVADLNRKRKRRKTRKSTNMQRSAEKDPLQSFNDGDINLDGLDGDDTMEGTDVGDVDDMPDFGPERDAKKQKKDDPAEKKIFANTRDGTGKSTAGRNAWKEKHRKGKFSGKKRMSERRKRDPLGI
ncbi:helicase domain protein [Nitzschia inconspicua]|uniref:RNA helicase n=1 Tax=Nitzschia inconspicua TaxID=303405 RepID=A0A9K3KPR5_9STRA|nr:helicase domain protein [Nitzschia inconspicua]